MGTISNLKIYFFTKDNGNGIYQLTDAGFKVVKEALYVLDHASSSSQKLWSKAFDVKYYHDLVINENQSRIDAHRKNQDSVIWGYRGSFEQACKEFLNVKNSYEGTHKVTKRSLDSVKNMPRKIRRVKHSDDEGELLGTDLFVKSRLEHGVFKKKKKKGGISRVTDGVSKDKSYRPTQSEQDTYNSFDGQMKSYAYQQANVQGQSNLLANGISREDQILIDKAYKEQSINQAAANLIAAYKSYISMKTQDVDKIKAFRAALKTYRVHVRAQSGQIRPKRIRTYS